MKKLIKAMIFITGLCYLINALNRYIFNSARLKAPIAARKEHFYRSRHGKIRYVVTGAGKPLLLVHGIFPGAGLFEWERCVASLSKHYKVYAVDLLGFGQSAKPDTTYSPYLYVTLMNDFVSHIIGGKTAVAANGLAASYAVLAANFRPDLYEKLLLVAPEGLSDDPGYPTGRCVWQRWLFESPLFGTTLYNVMTSKAYTFWFLREYGFASAALAGKLASAFNLSAHLGGLNAKLPVAALKSRFLNTGIVHALPNLAVPIAAAWGDCNDLNPIDNFNRLKFYSPLATLAIFEGGKLFPHVDEPEKFAKVCREFFN